MVTEKQANAIDRNETKVHFIYNSKQKGLIAHITYQNQPMTDAQVSFEI